MTNPLLDLDLPLPFHKVEASHIEAAILEHIKSGNKILDELCLVAPSTYAATFGALEKATEKLEFAMGVVEHLESVNSSAELRSAYNLVLPTVSQFYSQITLNAGVYRALQDYHRQVCASERDTEALSPTQRRFMKKTLDDFRRHGAELAPPEKKRLEEIDQELSRKTTTFSQNVLDGTNRFELLVGEEAMVGMPQFAKIAARESAQSKGLDGYRLTLQAPSVIPLLTYADDASLREKVWRAFNLRGRTTGDNLPLVVDILKLRRERARLLGFSHFADLATADRMAKTGKEAADFVEDLRSRTQSSFDQETRDLQAFRKSLEGAEAPELAPWDVSYYAEKMRRKLYDFDEEQLRPYFSAPKVLKGAFELAERIFGIEIREVDLPVWENSVRSHQILNAEGKVLGVFYTDLYPRESKRDGAWMQGLVAGTGSAPHVALFCTNAQPPTKDTPSLMSFRDVETVFHEFGHLLHHCLSEVSVRSLACTRVAQDFVELPSQIMENWCSEKEALDGFARHYQNDEPLARGLMDQFLGARNFRAGTAQMRQLGFSALDLALHIDFDPESCVDVNTFANSILQKYAVTPLPQDHSLIASFSHLFSHPVGYAAGYYSYKWAEVLDADAFSRFREEGLFNRATGDDFRRTILARGDSAEALELFTDFMGRPPRVEPMLVRQGLNTGA